MLEGAGVRLRAHTDADVPRIVEACSDPRGRRYPTTLPRAGTEAQARAFVRDARLAESLGTGVIWAVTDGVDDRLLADVGIVAMSAGPDPAGGEVGYRAHPAARGRGVVSAAVRLAVEHAFRPVADGGLGRRRLRLGVAWTDDAGRHVAERAGFVLVGRHRGDRVLGDGTITDVAWYDRLATDG